MNIFALFFAYQYLKIIGDFSNDPDAFADPKILIELERESSQNPKKK